MFNILLNIFAFNLPKQYVHQNCKHFSIFFSFDFQCGYTKGYSPQHSLVLMIDKWKEAVDNNNKVFGGLLTGLSKAFDWICHDLIVIKLNAYGLVFSCFKNDTGLSLKLKTKKQNRVIVQ